MDADYIKNLDESGAPVSEFECSLLEYATVMSKTAQNRAVLDAGFKALRASTQVHQFLPTMTMWIPCWLRRAWNGTDIGPTNHPFQIGDKVRLIPGHCDPTVNLYDWYVGYRQGRVGSALVDCSRPWILRMIDLHLMGVFMDTRTKILPHYGHARVSSARLR